MTDFQGRGMRSRGQSGRQLHSTDCELADAPLLADLAHAHQISTEAQDSIGNYNSAHRNESCGEAYFSSNHRLLFGPLPIFWLAICYHVAELDNKHELSVKYAVPPDASSLW